MGVDLTILDAGTVSLSKRFTESNTFAYPNVRDLTSIVYQTALSAAGIRERFDLIREHARNGCCMLKGSLTRPIVNESRKGMTDKLAPTHTLILDIDDFELLESQLPEKVDAQTLRTSAEMIVEALPVALRSVSYIAHASASFGRKRNSVSMHLEFLLERAVHPRALKSWLQYINLTEDAFTSRLTLSNSGHTLHWPLDPSVADNSKVIFIAPPTFDGVDDPFTSPDDRFVLVEKALPSVDLLPVISEVKAAAVDALKQDKLTALRKAAGLKKFTPKLSRLRVDGYDIKVINNPDSMNIQLERVDDKWAIFNINNGDSCAYYCPIGNPHVIYNFKGEQPFEFEKADPDTYEAFCRRFNVEVKRAQKIVPMVLRDAQTDTLYHLKYNQEKDTIQFNDNTGTNYLYPIRRESVEDFMADQGVPAPETIETWDVIFDPHNTTVLDGNRRRLNRYSPPDWVRNPPAMDDELKMALAPYVRDRCMNGAILRILCPTIYKLMWHFTGSTTREFEHFINWLAFCFNERRVSTTTWIFSGTQGTGKGLFAEHVLAPLMGHSYTKLIRQSNLEDQFNAVLGESLFLVVDEFRLKNSKGDSKFLDYIKNIIVSERGQVREMRQSQRTIPLHLNFLFFSNHMDVIELEEGDRRFNVASPQRKKLFTEYPELETEIHKLEEEVPNLAAFFAVYPYDSSEARTVLDNSAKQEMKVASMTPAAKFCFAARTGDLDYFLEYCYTVTTDVNESIRLAAAQKVINRWVLDARHSTETRVTVAELRTVYHALNPDQSIPQQRFTRLLTVNNLPTRPIKVNGRTVRGFDTSFAASEFDLDTIDTPQVEEDTCTQNIH